MLCAAELLQVKEKAEKAYQEEQARLDMECAIQLIKKAEKTIEFCKEVIGKDLQEKAETRKELKVEYWIKIYADRLNNELFRLIKPDGHVYADGMASMDSAGDYYSLTALQSYLEGHCYKVKIEPIEYKTYGLGTRHGNKIIITI
jgi:hypothetical protein